ncbi:Holliday junction branch migration protein RuvA [Candidatus Symbiobacter mobilis]|uniref:Holliday junction branch migration complex subunit RuvA n=1 Tax=Candidatus Symbiobacter mobilis CR TaxID=946483 RepID=U5NA64_9BURK|nr:Holliday junction branch migration protein RuvA [Candidatus Symbiobacter mobilis]AGX87079.1 holliday junction DNA helicase RuvA [Candidatus Symbiobacter mobilis CR]
MIGKLTGILAEKNPPDILLDCHGVGYEVQVPMSTFYVLPACGETTSLLTHLVVREDAHTLYGFATTAERRAFRELLRITGVGPRTALCVLSGMSPDDLSRAVTTQDTGPLMQVPGIGKKTAQRLLLELKGRLGDAATAPVPGGDATKSDILQALLSLGYSDREASTALQSLPEGVSVSDGIRKALQALAK